MEYMWRGNFDEENKKIGKGKEYDFDDNIIFEGEYSNDLRIKGVEFYIKGTKKFAGDYKNNKRWNGFLYDITNEHKYEIISGNGFIKEYYENGCLFFEGELKNGEKTGKEKIYDECGHLIFEGNLENGIKQGKGKTYNYSGDIIFEGEFDKDKEIKGKDIIKMNKGN